MNTLTDPRSGADVDADGFDNQFAPCPYAEALTVGASPGIRGGRDVERFHIRPALWPFWASSATFEEPDFGDVV